MRVRVTRVREEMRACAGAQAVRQAIRSAKKAEQRVETIEGHKDFRRRGECHAGGDARWSGK